MLKEIIEKLKNILLFSKPITHKVERVSYSGELIDTHYFCSKEDAEKYCSENPGMTSNVIEV